MRITPARRGELDDIARLLADALGDDDVIRRIVPAGPRRDERILAFFRADIERPDAELDTIDVARDDDGTVLGVAVWSRPGAAGGGARALPHLLRSVHPPHLFRTLRALRAFARYRPRFPHWFLGDIVVPEAGRGKGVGSALLESRLAAVDADGLPAYLEATTVGSRRLYAKHGFTSIARIGGPAGAFAMLRPAAGAS